MTGPAETADVAIAAIPARVAKGAALLDEAKPGWWRHVNLATLDVADCVHCTLGQLYGRFSLGLLMLFGGRLLPYTPTRHGFSGSTSSVGDAGGFRTFRALTAEWTRVILERRADASYAKAPEGGAA